MQMRIEKTDTYIGDGLYVSDDGFMYTIKTERENGVHWVAMEDDVLADFFRFIEKARDVKITVEHAV